MSTAPDSTYANPVLGWTIVNTLYAFWRGVSLRRCAPGEYVVKSGSPERYPQAMRV